MLTFPLGRHLRIAKGPLSNPLGHPKRPVNLVLLVLPVHPRRDTGTTEIVQGADVTTLETMRGIIGEAVSLNTDGLNVTSAIVTRSISVMKMFGTVCRTQSALSSWSRTFFGG